MGKMAFYCYGIKEFKQAEEKNEYIEMCYGENKESFFFNISDLKKFLKAILQEFDEEEWKKIHKETSFESKKVVALLNLYLKGRGFVLATENKNELEYFNRDHSKIVGITHINLDGELAFKYRDFFRNIYDREDIFEKSELE